MLGNRAVQVPHGYLRGHCLLPKSDGHPNGGLQVCGDGGGVWLGLARRVEDKSPFHGGLVGAEGGAGQAKAGEGHFSAAQRVAPTAQVDLKSNGEHTCNTCTHTNVTNAHTQIHMYQHTSKHISLCILIPKVGKRDVGLDLRSRRCEVSSHGAF